MDAGLDTSVTSYQASSGQGTGKAAATSWREEKLGSEETGV